ncbi:MAG: FG-GAP-like repeat-containing protein [Candidatus Kariarchaeaceae archaeon]|jgi:hypothetical protein
MKSQNYLIFITFYFLILTISVNAQVIFTKVLIDTNFIDYSYPFDLKAAEINGDNETDLVLSSPDYTTGENSIYLWYQNDGEENFSKNVIDTALIGGGVLDVADIDGDSDIDLVLGASDRNTWFENDGIGNFSKFILDFMSISRFLIISDFDDDIDNDIIIKNNFGIYWQENDSSQNFIRDTVEAISVVDNAIAITDLDNDLDQDVVAAIYPDENYILVWYINDGNENFTRDTIEIYEGNMPYLVTEDLDQDDDKDIIAAEQNYIVWYQNDGSENFSKDTIEFNFNRNPGSLTVCDIDDDGDNDVIVTGGNNTVGGVFYYENDGEENFTKHTIDNSAGNRQRLVANDIDKDGDIDLFVTNNFPSEFVFYRNDGLTKLDEKIHLSIPAKFNLAQNYPNPFNPKTIINYELPITNYVELSIYNLRGQIVATLVSEKQNAGYHQLEWDASYFSSGIYYYLIQTGKFRDVKKMVLLR